ncbi:FAD-binding domain-containing protein [Xylaria digitata]|nr:FAD-binding domain-containing protein [Xylaria digitata]
MASSLVFAALKQAIPEGEFSLPTAELHEQPNSSYLSEFESDLKPSCISRPSSTDQVVTLVKTIRPFIHQGNTAIRGGGQQPAPGITVDLSLITGVDCHDLSIGRCDMDVDEKNQIFRIGAGARWGRVYEVLDGSGLSGLSFFSSREGFICDNVLNYEVVLASGNIFYMLSSLPDQIQKLVTELTEPDPSPETHLMMSIGFAGAVSPVPVGLNTVYYTQVVENPPVLDPFVAVDTKIGQFSSAAGVSMQIRCAYMNITTKADAAALQACTKLYEGALEPVQAPYAKSLLQKSQARGRNSLGLYPEDGPLVNVLLLSYWKNTSDDDTIVNMMKTAPEKMRQEAASRNQLVPYVYMNYAFTNQDPISSYGEPESKISSAVAKEYDLDGVFQRGFPGPFKLPAQ